jgi:tetratricopeptide (TPR) repeat protein
MNYHYGKIQLNQAIIAIQTGNLRKGENLLAEAEGKLKAWNTLQSDLALAYLLLHENSKAVTIIRDALYQDPEWKEHLPSFYVLKDEPGMEGLIDERKFTERDWINAVSFLGELNRDEQAASVCQEALLQFPQSSYLHYLFGKALLSMKKNEEARRELQWAVNLDLSNHEALDFLKHSVR